MTHDIDEKNAVSIVLSCPFAVCLLSLGLKHCKLEKSIYKIGSA